MQGHTSTGPPPARRRLVTHDRHSGILTIDIRRLRQLAASAVRRLRPRKRPLTSAEYDRRFGPMPERLTARAVHERQGTEPLPPEEARRLLKHLPTDGEG